MPQMYKSPTEILVHKKAGFSLISFCCKRFVAQFRTSVLFFGGVLRTGVTPGIRISEMLSVTIGQVFN